MNLKTKIFTLIVAGLLIIPVLFNPPRSQSVLGVSDNVSESNQETSQDKSEPVSSTNSAGKEPTAQESVAPTPKPDSQPAPAPKQTQTNNQTQSSSGSTDSSSSSRSSQSSSSLRPNISLPKLNFDFDFRLPFSGGRQSRSSSPNTQPQASNFQVKDITSGVRHKIESDEDVVNSSTPIAKGIIKWAPSSTTSITTNKYELGSSILVSTQNKQGVNLVVSQSQALPVDTILVVDQNTFIQLGGDPETQQSIFGTIIKNN